MRYTFFFLLIAALMGCSGMKTKDLDTSPATISRANPSDDLPLLPRESAKETWERSNRPLPPLPIRQKAVPIAQEPIPATPTLEVEPQVSQIPPQDVEIIANRPVIEEQPPPAPEP